MAGWGSGCRSSDLPGVTGSMSFMDHVPVGPAPTRDQRRARLVRGTLRLTGGREVAVVVRNVSERGLGLSCRSVPPLTGERVTICLPGSPELAAVVRWVRNTSFGVELVDTVDPDDLAATLQREIARIKEATDWKVSRRHHVVAPPATTPRRIV